MPESKEIDLLSDEESPAWFEYPGEFLRIVDYGLFYLEPWQILEGEWLRVRLEGLKERFPNRDLVPFFRSLACDNVACWERGKPGKVAIIHDFASPGWEDATEYDNFWSWFRATIEEMIEYE